MDLPPHIGSIGNLGSKVKFLSTGGNIVDWRRAVEDREFGTFMGCLVVGLHIPVMGQQSCKVRNDMFPKENVSRWIEYFDLSFWLGDVTVEWR